MQKNLFLGLRLAMAFIFLWAFLDKLFGWGFATKSADSWLNGGSPTTGFLSFATRGPLEAIFKSMAGIAVVDWLFMLGLLGVGLTLLLNRYVKWGALAGIVMMLLMWLAAFPPENNPFVDEHIVYALVLGILSFAHRKVE